MTESESVALPLGDTPIFKLLRYFSRLLRFYQAFLCRFHKIFLSDRRNRVKLRRRNARPQASIAFAAKSLYVSRPLCGKAPSRPFTAKHSYASRTFVEKHPYAPHPCKKIAAELLSAPHLCKKGAPVRAFDGRRKLLRQKRPGKKTFARGKSGMRPLRPTKALRRSFRR